MAAVVLALTVPVGVAIGLCAGYLGGVFVAISLGLSAGLAMFPADATTHEALHRRQGRSVGVQAHGRHIAVVADAVDVAGPE